MSDSKPDCNEPCASWPTLMHREAFPRSRSSRTSSRIPKPLIGAINALFCFRPEQAWPARSSPKRAGRRKRRLGPLDGVPMTVKDSVAMVGWPYFHGVGANRSTAAVDLRLPAGHRAARGRRGDLRQDHHAGLRPDGVRHQFIARRHPQPLGAGLEHRRIVRGRRRLRCRRCRFCLGRDRYCRLGSPAGRALRARVAEANPRPRTASARRHHADGWADGAQRRRYRAPA